MRFYIALYLTPCGASSERGECLTWVRLTDRQPEGAHVLLLALPTRAHHLHPRVSRIGLPFFDCYPRHSINNSTFTFVFMIVCTLSALSLFFPLWWSLFTSSLLSFLFWVVLTCPLNLYIPYTSPTVLTFYSTLFYTIVLPEEESTRKLVPFYSFWIHHHFTEVCLQSDLDVVSNALAWVMGIVLLHMFHLLNHPRWWVTFRHECSFHLSN